jgi:TPR repeat protein
MEQTNNNQKEAAANRYAYLNEGDAFAQLWQQAEQGDLKAQKEVAYRIYFHVQENTDPLANCEIMIRYLKNLADHGDEHAMFVLGETYYCGYEGVGLGRQDLEESVQWFKLAAEKGNVQAQEWMAEAYFEGHFIDGELFTERAADAPLWLLKMPRERRIDDFVSRKSFGNVVVWYTQAAKTGNPDAQCSLGDLYYNGDCVKENKKEAHKWYMKAAQQGHAAAQYSYGWDYYYGEGVAQDRKEAFKWFSLSAQQGYSAAQVNLGDYYYQGCIVEQNYEMGIELYKKAAAQNECRAFMRIAADCVDRKEDYKEAAKWYRKAANHGNWLACYRLGLFYQDGKGVKQNDKEAAKWFRKAKKLN